MQTFACVSGRHAGHEPRNNPSGLCMARYQILTRLSSHPVPQYYDLPRLSWRALTWEAMTRGRPGWSVEDIFGGDERHPSQFGHRCQPPLSRLNSDVGRRVGQGVGRGSDMGVGLWNGIRTRLL